MLSFKTDEKQSRKNLKIDKDGVAALRARQMNLMQMNPMPRRFAQDPWGMSPGLGLAALPAMHNGRHIRSITSSPQMPNPFFGGAQLPPGLGLVAGMMGQPQNTQMENPFFGPMMGPRMPMKGGGFGPGYDPWSSLQIHPKVAEKLKDQPAVGLFF